MGRRCLPSVVLRRGSLEMLFAVANSITYGSIYAVEDPADSGPLRRLELNHRFCG